MPKYPTWFMIYSRIPKTSRIQGPFMRTNTTLSRGVTRTGEVRDISRALVITLYSHYSVIFWLIFSGFVLLAFKSIITLIKRKICYLNTDVIEEQCINFCTNINPDVFSRFHAKLFISYTTRTINVSSS